MLYLSLTWGFSWKSAYVQPLRIVATARIQERAAACIAVCRFRRLSRGDKKICKVWCWNHLRPGPIPSFQHAHLPNRHICSTEAWRTISWKVCNSGWFLFSIFFCDAWLLRFFGLDLTMFRSSSEFGPYDYSRSGNPTRTLNATWNTVVAAAHRQLQKSKSVAYCSNQKDIK